MSKQYGKAYMDGKKAAMQRAGDAVSVMQDKGVYAMALIHKLLFSHPDKDLVEKAHNAIMQSGMDKQYLQAIWYGSDSGMFLNELPPMSKKQGCEYLFETAQKHGWMG